MARPWDVTSDDVEQWSRRVDAPGVLPDLVRRLLLATMPLSRISMSAHAGTRLPGLDGVVHALDESPFCPVGPSVWELSVEGDVRKKLDPDFRKRSDEHGAHEASRTTYVAVSARRVPGKMRWEADRQAERVWRGVRLLDAEDLAAWLAMAPAVGRWFAAKIGHAAADAEDVEELLDRWSRRTRVRLPVEIALAGQDRQRLAEEVRVFARSVGRARETAPLRVHADSWEEAVVFAAAALQTDPSPEGEQVRARTIVARDAELVRAALRAQAAQPLIVIAAYAGAGAEVGPVVVPLEGAIPAGARDVLEVKPAPYLRFVEILERAGMPKPEAERVARASGGSLAALQQVLGYVTQPRWAEGIAPVPLAVLLLAGAFEPGNEEDRAVLALLGADAGEVEQLCERLRLAPEAPTIKEMARSHRPVWQWRPEGAAWKALAGQVPAEVLRRFAETVTLVLEERPPAREEAWAAALQGKSLRPSGSLRVGLTRSLVWLAVSDEELEKLHGRARGSALAASVVRALLPVGWERWASLSELLPLLAEAAPEAFLDCMEASLRHGDAGVAHLLAEEKPMGGAPHTGLLWALETLGWDAALMPRVASALARLAEADAKLPEQSGRLSNRPARSLKGLLRMTWPQTAATAEQRIAEVKRRLVETPKVGFDFLAGEIAGVGDMVLLDPSREPEIRPLPVLDRDAQNERRRGEGSVPGSYLDIALEHAGHDTERWVGLLRRVRPDPYVAGLLLDRLETVKDSIDDKDALLWGAIRHCISRMVVPDHEEPPEPDVPSYKEIHERWQRLYARFRPPDVGLRYAWLFLPNAELPRPFDPKRDYEENHAELQRLQVQAVVDIGWKLPVLCALAERVASTSNLGWVLARAPYVAQLDRLLLDAPPPSCFTPQVPTYFLARSSAQGIEWAHEKLRALFAQGRRDDLGACLANLPHWAASWDFVDTLGEEVARAYWRGLSYLHPNASAEDRERAVLRLLEAGNVATAMSAVRRENGEISYQLIATVLSALVTAGPEEMSRSAHGGLMSYDLGKLMDKLESAPDVEEKYAALLGHAELLHGHITFDSKRPMKRLSALFASQPKDFVTLVERMYRPTGEPPPERTPEEQAEVRQLAEGAYRILNVWKGWPGEGMPEQAEQGVLYEWALQVLRALAAGGRPDTGAIEVARVLARPGKGADGHWPCLAARQILELDEFPGLAAYLRIAKWNLRGVHGRSLGDGGKQERAIAATHREAARALRPGYPRTADMLDALAAEYEQDAVREDEQADATMRQYGAEPHDFDGRTAPAPAPQPPPSPPPPSPSPKRRAFRPGIVTLESITLTDFTCFDRLTLAPVPPQVERGQWLILIGENGQGKTSLLRALALALAGTNVAQAVLGQFEAPLIRWGSEMARCEVVSGGERFAVTITDPEKLGETAACEPQNGPRPRLYGRGCYAGLGGQGSIELGSLSSDIVTLFSDATHTFAVRSWFKDLKLRALQSAEHARVFATVGEKLAALLPGVSGFDVRGNRVYAVAPDLGGDIPLESLSDGYRTTLAWTGELCARWLHWAEQVGESTEGDFFARMEGLVLIDEIDLHLHPRWQRDIVRLLKDVFPRLSFVMTTHNPLTLLGADPGEIVVLRRPADGSRRTEARQFDLPAGIPADRVLTGEWFGLESTVDDDTRTLVEDHQRLLRSGVPEDDPGRVALEEKLAKRYGSYGDTSLDRMALEVAADLMAERRPKTPEDRREMRDKIKQRVQGKLAAKARRGG